MAKNDNNLYDLYELVEIMNRKEIKSSIDGLSDFRKSVVDTCKEFEKENLIMQEYQRLLGLSKQKVQELKEAKETGNARVSIIQKEENELLEKQALLLNKIKNIEKQVNTIKKNNDGSKIRGKEANALNSLNIELEKYKKQEQDVAKSVNKTQLDRSFLTQKTNKDYINGLKEVAREQEKLIKLRDISNKKLADTSVSNMLSKTFTNFSRFALYAKTGLGFLNQIFGGFGELEKAVFSLGVVSGKTTTQTRELRQELLRMSADSIYTAKDLSESLDLIVRTGKTLMDAQQILDQTSKLSLASFDSLSFATQTVNKAMIALEISSSHTTEVVNQFHNIVASTPLSLRSLDESLRQSASSFGAILDFTSKAGAELEAYKVAVSGTVASLAGAQSMLGRTGLSSGSV